MRLGVLDVGSNTVHLLVVDAEPGVRPLPASDDSWPSPLLEHIGADGGLTKAGERSLLQIVAEAQTIASKLGAADFVAFATSALRDATNAEKVLARVRDEVDVDIAILNGEEEARLTFLAARRWFGWSSGRLMVMDIGGGSLELAIGGDEVAQHAISLPLGARRLTREFLPLGQPTDEHIAQLREHVSAQLASRIRPFREHTVDLAVGTSKTMRSLARVAGAASSRDGDYVRRVLRAEDAANMVDKLAGMDRDERAKLPGVSARRAPQLLAGAVVAATAMTVLKVPELVICPWALREGIFLTRQDWIISL
jgi:exopolyphosphatase / guanosine-5'-triphosphate,3'-diphosphate pyrophosphatase